MVSRSNKRPQPAQPRAYTNPQGEYKMNENTTQEAVANTANEFHNVIMAISETNKATNKREFSKFLPYSLPTLDMVAEGLPAPDKWVEAEIEGADGEKQTVRVPEYADSTLDFVQGAITQRIQGLARSRDKAGQTPAQNWEELAESGGTKYPVQLKQFRADFLAFLQSEEGGATEKQATALLSYCDAKVLMSQPHERKEAIAGWINRFLEAYGDKAGEVASVTGALSRALNTNLDDVEL